MSAQQFIAIFTLGFASAIALLGLVAGAAVLACQFGCLSNRFPTALALGLGSPVVAFWIVVLQQTIAYWLANRLITRLERELSDLEHHLGTKKAKDCIREKGLKLSDQLGRFCLFDLEQEKNVLTRIQRILRVQD